MCAAEDPLELVHRDARVAEWFVEDKLQKQASHSLLRSVVAQLEQVLARPVTDSTLPNDWDVHPRRDADERLVKLPDTTLCWVNTRTDAVTRVLPHRPSLLLLAPGEPCGRPRLHKRLLSTLRPEERPPMAHNLGLVSRPVECPQGFGQSHGPRQVVASDQQARCSGQHEPWASSLRCLGEVQASDPSANTRPPLPRICRLPGSSSSHRRASRTTCRDKGRLRGDVGKAGLPPDLQRGRTHLQVRPMALHQRVLGVPSPPGVASPARS